MRSASSLKYLKPRVTYRTPTFHAHPRNGLMPLSRRKTSHTPISTGMTASVQAIAPWLYSPALSLRWSHWMNKV